MQKRLDTVGTRGFFRATLAKFDDNIEDLKRKSKQIVLSAFR